TAFPDTGALLSAQREVAGRIQQQRSLSAPQQEALHGLFKEFPSAALLEAANAAVEGQINEKRGEVIAELQSKDSLPVFGVLRQENVRVKVVEFPSAALLEAANAAVEGQINEKRGEVIAELQSKDSLPVFGGAAGEKALVVEFSDYLCPDCKRMFGVLRQENVRVKVVEFPIFGKLSRTASEYALAAQNQNLYGEYHIALMSQGRLTEETLLKTAESVGLDVEKLKTDSKSEEVAEKIKENFRMARLLGVRGTPFLVVGDQSVHGAVGQERLREMLAEIKQ
ncbi:MAG: DsbA family protein, partial [Betaproteobacteria bacterium]|nr:DsbA family protein [Betaproteobacteria bacterium]